MGKCQFVIESLPAYTPQLVAFLIVLVELFIVIIAYIARETQRKKTFYGREDFEAIPEEEKMEHEGAIMGKNDEELRIVQSKDRTIEIDPGSARTASTGVKVMVRRKKAKSGISDGTESQIQNFPANTMTIRFTLDVDRTTRGFEFINLIQKSVEEVEEFKNIQQKLSDEAEDRLCDFLVRKMRTLLEQSTQCKWLVHGVILNKKWKVSGQNNLLEPGGDIRMQQMLRVTAQGPMTPVVILAYLIEIDMGPVQMRTRNAQSPGAMSRSRIPVESATQSVTRTYGKTLAKIPLYSPIPPKPSTTLEAANYAATQPTSKKSMSTSQLTRRGSAEKIVKNSSTNRRSPTDTEALSRFRSGKKTNLSIFRTMSERTQSEH